MLGHGRPEALRALVLAVLLAGCAAETPAPENERDPEIERVASLTLLRPGQAYLGGALEVTRYAFSGGRVDVTVANRTARVLAVRWRFRYVGADGWEIRGRDSAAWKEAEVGVGEEWKWEGPAEVGVCQAVGMDWRYQRE